MKEIRTSTPMPFTYQLDDARRRLFVTLTPPCTVDDVLAAINRQIADGAWTYGLLYDSTGYVASTAEVGRVVARLNHMTEKLGPRGPVAIVLACDVGRGVVRTYSILAERAPGRIAVFYSLDEAAAWLDRQMG